MAHRTIIGLAVIFMLAVLQRLLFLGKESLSLDESVSAWIARMDWSHFRSVLWHGQANMALFYVLLHFWTALGRTEFALRALSVLCSVATVPVFYVFGARMSGPRIGLIAALLLAQSTFHIRYAQTARSYALLVLLVTLSSLFFVFGIQRPSSKTWTLYVISTVAAVYSHFFGVLVFAAHWVSVVFLRPRDVPWKFLVVSTGAIGMLLLPLGAFALTKDTGQINWIPRPGFDAVPRVLVYLAGASPAQVTFTPRGPRTTPGLFAAAEVGRRLLLLLYAAALTVALFRMTRSWASARKSFRTWNRVFLFTWLLIPPIFAYGFSMIKPIFVSYYLIVSLPPLIFLAAESLSRIRRAATLIAALILFVCLTALQTVSYYAYAKNEDWRGATAFILTRVQPGDAIILYPRHPTAFDYYRDQLEMGATEGSPATLALDDPRRSNYRRIWLLVREPVSEAEAAVAATHRLIAETDFEDIRVLLYGKANSPGN